MRLLVVEDEPALCQSIAEGLRLDGYEVDTCGDGQEALELCCVERFALILLDLLTGLAKAKLQGRLNSDTGYKGFWRKAALLAALVAWICCRSTPLQPSGTPGTSSTSADPCPHYTSAGIRCKSCPCGEQFSGGPCSPL